MSNDALSKVLKILLIKFGTGVFNFYHSNLHRCLALHEPEII